MSFQKANGDFTVVEEETKEKIKEKKCIQTQ
jgi:hypothetical protein